MDANLVILTGHMGKAPITRFTASGRNVCTFRMATNREWPKSDGTTGQSTQWHTVTCWSKLGEIVQKWAEFGKRHVYVEGRLEYERFTDDKGIERFYTKVVARNVSFLDKKPANISVDQETVAEPDPDPEIVF